MKLALQKLKILKSLSDETACFEAGILLDGKLVGRVENRGNGGPNRYEWNDPAVGKAINAWAKGQPLEFAFEQLDQIIGRLMDEAEYLKWVQRKIKKETLFRLAGDAAGAWRTVKKPYDAGVRNFIAGKYGDKVEVIANENLELAVKLGR